MSAAAPWAFPLELLLEIASHHRGYYDFLSPIGAYIIRRLGNTYLDPVFPLVDFLSRLANLTSLRIYNLPNSEQVQTNIGYAFGLARFPAITTLYIPYRLVGAFEAFSNVKTFAAPTIPGRLFPQEAKESFPHLDALAGLRMTTKGVAALIDDLAQKFPRLRSLSIRSPLETEHSSRLQLLNAFTQLRELVLVYLECEGCLPLDAIIEGGKKILMGSQSTETKVLKVWCGDSCQIIHVECW
ncbi:hypothetical protein DFH06DRAFT_1318781 [Mycena polygramma]|nr:hypothetical protein DFH06DRAFT_1318781 [Mycena polygramma]